MMVITRMREYKKEVLVEANSANITVIGFRGSIQLTGAAVGISLLFQIVSILDGVVFITNNHSWIHCSCINVAKHGTRIAEHIYVSCEF